MLKAFGLEQAALWVVEDRLSISTLAEKRTKPVLGSKPPGLIDLLSITPITGNEGKFETTITITLAVPLRSQTVQIILDAIAKCIPSDFLSDILSGNCPSQRVLSNRIAAIDRSEVAFLIFSQSGRKSES